MLVSARLEPVLRFPKVSDPPELSTIWMGKLLVLIVRLQRSKVRPVWVVSPTRLRGAGHSTLPNLGHLVLRQLQGAPVVVNSAETGICGEFITFIV